MDVVVDLGTGKVTLADPGDLQHFAVRAVQAAQAGGGAAPGTSTGELDELAAALVAHDVGHVDPDGSVRVDVAAVRRLAGSEVPVTAEWESGFASMLEYAAAKGWVADDGTIRAHVEWQVAS
ncbi:MAG: hypothetical protein ACLQOZ_02575 [Acidimicrobiales bacterium]|jgi:hypothetical protein